MDMGLLALLKTAGVDMSSVAVILLLWRMTSIMTEQKETLTKLIHGLDKRVAVLEAKDDV